MNPKKSVEQRALTGNAGRRPLGEDGTRGLRRSDQIPPAPVHLSEEARIEWDLTARDLWEGRLLATVDVRILEQYVVLVVLARNCQRTWVAEGTSVKSKRSAARQHPAVRTYLQVLPQIKNFADALGIGAKARGHAHPLAGGEQMSIFDAFLSDEDDSRTLGSDDESTRGDGGSKEHLN